MMFAQQQLIWLKFQYNYVNINFLKWKVQLKFVSVLSYIDKCHFLKCSDSRKERTLLIVHQHQAGNE